MRYFEIMRSLESDLLVEKAELFKLLRKRWVSGTGYKFGQPGSEYFGGSYANEPSFLWGFFAN